MEGYGEINFKLFFFNVIDTYVTINDRNLLNLLLCLNFYCKILPLKGDKYQMLKNAEKLGYVNFLLSVIKSFTSLLIVDGIKGLIHILYLLINISVYCY